MLGFSRDNMIVAPARSPLRRVLRRRDFVEPGGRPDRELRNRSGRPSPSSKGSCAHATVCGRASPTTSTWKRPRKDLSFWDNISRVLFVAFPGLVAISLVVGGIVIMNIMLVSVMERTREIGVRKAIGARRKDIVLQVLIETATLSGVGALAGIGIGIVLTMIVRAASPLPAAVAPHWIALGVALGVTVGVLAGVYPASRAAKLDPVDALRYE